MKEELVSIILTAYNEERNIKGIIQACRKLKKKFPIEIIVVDGGSKDKTVAIAKKMRVDKVLDFPFKRGKGADFWVGALLARGEYIIQIDSDHQFQPYEIPLFVDQLREGADVVIGTRFDGGRIEKGSISMRNFFGNWVMSILTSIACGKKITDVMAGFKGFHKSALKALDLKERHFEYEAEVVTKAVKMGMDLRQLPITYKKRRKGVSGIRAIRDGINVTLAILKVITSKLPQYSSLRN